MSPFSDGAWSLEVTLSVTALCEFVLFRLARIPFPAVTTPGSSTGLAGVVAFLGNFALNLTAVLAVLVTAILLVRAIGPHHLGRNPVGRTAIALMGAVFVFLAGGLVLAPGAVASGFGLTRAQWLTHTSGLCLAVLMLLAILPSPHTQRRHKLALALLLFPPLMLMENQWGLISNRTALRAYTLWLMLYGPIAAVALVSVGGLLLLPPHALTTRRGGMRLGGMLASILTISFGMLLIVRRGLASKLALVTFDLHLPAVPLPQLVFTLGVSAWVFAVTVLLSGTASERRRSIGLLLVGLAGSQPRAVHQIGLYLAGILCLAEVLFETPRPAAAQPAHSVH